ncbi:vWA domain-containing protein [Nocardiopsis ansamitocini]|uniref:VWA domain-containing protein n=1 Tax=Nocardiopsis ansamitocini TaxID=1670832 RepID=A0A9W6UH59_9ACTN|nr:VWA domain-containing protein [Nocardiopsis ansamitocini]GLU46008.1 VWA domain-containing protein [Nocardiopsis ansamitocini]
MRSPATDPDVTAVMLGFVRALRAAGLPADTARAQAFLRALGTLDVTDATDAYWAGRLTLCAGAADLPAYDACFAYYFAGAPRRHPVPPGPMEAVRAPMWRPEAPKGPPPAREEAEQASAASDVDVLRAKDLATLDPAERAEVARLLALLATRREQRRTHRMTPAARGRLDYARTIRATLRSGGEPVRLLHRSRTTRPRRVVLLIDVSGSMAPYADALLRLAHAVTRGDIRNTETFSVGTRLTRLTSALRNRHADAAMAAAGAAIPDWSGGTRLGAELKEFLDLHGQRGMARGALVVVASDGWERGDAALLGDQMARLARLAHRVIWANPHKAQPGYAPLAAGMAAALPHVDDFVSGHSLGALEELATAVTGARTGIGGAYA